MPKRVSLFHSSTLLVIHYWCSVERLVFFFLPMAAKCLRSLSKGELKSFVDSFDVVLSDCDGVLWRETEVIEGSPQAVENLKKMGKKFFYVTNNNGKTREELVEKCKELSFNPTKEEIVCTSFLAAMYLKEKKFKKKVYVVGGIGITQELEAVGIPHTGVGPDPMSGDATDVIVNFKPDSDIGAVIVGFDTDFSYPKLVKAATYAADPNVHFIGANPDTVRPSPNSNMFPGAGCLIKAVEAAAGRKAVILGKPEPYISEYVIKTYGLDPARTLMIGDNCNTDILLGKRCGFKTLLVLSGVTSENDVADLRKITRQEDKQIVPDFYTERLSDLFQLLNE